MNTKLVIDKFTGFKYDNSVLDGCLYIMGASTQETTESFIQCAMILYVALDLPSTVSTAVLKAEDTISKSLLLIL